MLRTIAICPDPQIRGLWAEAIHNHREVVLLKTVAAYPEADLLLRVMRAHVPEIVFIDMQDAEASARVTRLIEKEFPGVQCVGLHPGAGPETLRQALRSGLREVLSPPFVRKDVDSVLAEVRRYLERQPATYRGAEHVLAFLPAKPGVGASIIASNAARAFSAHAGKRTLLADFDNYSGVVSFLFNAGEGYRMVDAAARAHELDEELWPQLVTKSAALDLLPSGAPHVGSEVARGQLSRIIEFARRQYDVICADLSGSFDGPSLEVLREVSQVFLVTTPEVAALHHARLKILALNDINFEGSVSLLLNRATTRAEFSRAEVEKLVGLPVSMEFPCSYAGVNKAIRDAQPVRELIPSCRRFADQVLQKKNPGAKRNRFVQYFALMPMRYGFRRAC